MHTALQAVILFLLLASAANAQLQTSVSQIVQDAEAALQTAEQIERLKCEAGLPSKVTCYSKSSLEFILAATIVQDI